MASVGGAVVALAGDGDGLFESSMEKRSGAASSEGSTMIVLPDCASHRNSMRFSLKKSRPLIEG